MPPRGLFLNLSRGFVADHEALAVHLRSGHLAGAAVDVFPDEPRAQGDAFSSPLRGLPNVILTPHVGGSTQEAQYDIGRFVAGKLLDHVQCGTTTMSVNLPAVALSGAGAARLAHLHRNVPGALARSNDVLARNGVHVDSQVLSTREDFGNALTQVHDSLSSTLVDELRTLPETIRLTVLDRRTR